MKIYIWIAFISAITLTAFSCASAPEDAIESKTVREIMAEMVGPSANTLWSSVSLIETEEGLEEKGPQTDADWLALRQSAELMLAASALLTRQGLSVAPAGTPAANPGVELDPAEIEELIDVNRGQWDRLSLTLGTTGRVYLDAVHVRDSRPLMDAGDELNSACENCHQVFWYPSN